MPTEFVDHTTLSRLVAQGTVRSAQIAGQGGGWVVSINCESSTKQLAAQRSKQVRVFRKLDTLVIYLRGLGLTACEIDTGQFAPMAIKPYARPDRAAALKQTHAVASYDKWFRQQVQSSIDDPLGSVPDETARARFSARKALLRAGSEAGA